MGLLCYLVSRDSPQLTCRLKAVPVFVWELDKLLLQFTGGRRCHWSCGGEQPCHRTMAALALVGPVGGTSMCEGWAAV